MWPMSPTARLRAFAFFCRVCSLLLLRYLLEGGLECVPFGDELGVDNVGHGSANNAQPRVAQEHNACGHVDDAEVLVGREKLWEEKGKKCKRKVGGRQGRDLNLLRLDW